MWSRSRRRGCSGEPRSISAAGVPPGRAGQPHVTREPRPASTLNVARQVPGRSHVRRLGAGFVRSSPAGRRLAIIGWRIRHGCHCRHTWLSPHRTPRELHKLLGALSGKTSQAALLAAAADLRTSLGLVSEISAPASSRQISRSTTMCWHDPMGGPSNQIYGWTGGEIGLADIFCRWREAHRAMSAHEALRRADTRTMALGVPAAEMTKWFDTNYHFLVPEFTADRPSNSPPRKLCEIS